MQFAVIWSRKYVSKAEKETPRAADVKIILKKLKSWQMENLNVD
jgi:hypothetical protein